MAEIMVVLFIMTIILAAFAPLMTVRAKSTSRTSPWNWATPDSANTYFGVHPNQRVMIGQKTKGNDINNKLTINTSGTQSHILFKREDTILGQLYLDSSLNFILGGSNASIPSLTNSNIGIGANVLQALTTGQANIAIGANNLKNNTTGEQNIAVGNLAMPVNTTGDENVALGHFALYTNSTAHDNTAIGQGTLYHNTTGWSNTALGHLSMYSNTTGSNNTSLGAQSLYDNVTGSNNTSVGYNACRGITTSNITCLGTNSGPHNTETNTNHVYIGNQYSTVYVYGTTELKTLIASSDARLKNIQGDYTSGLEQIKKIKPVNFTFKDDKKKTPRVGVIAQDLQKIFPKAVMKGDDGFLKIRQEDMFYSMINAIKDLAYRDDAKDKKIKELESRIEQLEKLVK